MRYMHCKLTNWWFYLHQDLPENMPPLMKIKIANFRHWLQFGTGHTMYNDKILSTTGVLREEKKGGGHC